ncbi:hypothetical protein Mmc1_0099 [Magnetococcus marinus MC-1]|uniref:Nitrogen regulatory protein P-II n=1 Tax=Magnetococcus marinus (strain ATCC BAA-1437 / JCM 17883 / MC-1) TaxID=156889 RepID=A0L3T5_MAGMM|nr:hypothetical protein [Magnetococcus marinus]ABK42628.1 hypothetical protein Mmc1_0099 [Magnetococcus marinus MC-1]
MSETQLVENKLITAYLPDDGSDKEVLKALHGKGIYTANSVGLRGISMLRPAKGKAGRLPESEAVKMVTVMVAGEEADEMFEFIFDKGHVGRQGGGFMFVSTLSAATLFTLPEDVQAEH